MDRQTGSAGGQGQQEFPLSNPEYDIISILHHKLQAIGAYQTYLKDARGSQELTSLIRESLEHDRATVERFHKLLHAFHQQGQGETGQTRTARS